MSGMVSDLWPPPTSMVLNGLSNPRAGSLSPDIMTSVNSDVTLNNDYEPCPQRIVLDHSRTSQLVVATSAESGRLESLAIHHLQYKCYPGQVDPAEDMAYQEEDTKADCLNSMAILKQRSSRFHHTGN